MDSFSFFEFEIWFRDFKNILQLAIKITYKKSIIAFLFEEKKEQCKAAGP